MSEKVVLVLVDGMRPDGLLNCGNPYVKELEKMCAYTYSAASMDPPVTLPCHFSMAHSAPPIRHGIITNTYGDDMGIPDGNCRVFGYEGDDANGIPDGEKARTRREAPSGDCLPLRYRPRRSRRYRVDRLELRPLRRTRQERNPA